MCRRDVIHFGRKLQGFENNILGALTNVFLFQTTKTLVTGSCNFLDRCSDAKYPYVHYVLDDPRANEESALCLRRDRLDIMPKLNPDEMRRVLSTTGPLLPISAIQADLRGFALEKVCGGGGGDNDEGRRRGGGEFRAVLIDPPWSISMALPFPSLRDGEIENVKITAVLGRTGEW